MSWQEGLPVPCCSGRNNSTPSVTRLNHSSSENETQRKEDQEINDIDNECGFGKIVSNLFKKCNGPIAFESNEPSPGHCRNIVRIDSDRVIAKLFNPEKNEEGLERRREKMMDDIPEMMRVSPRNAVPLTDSFTSVHTFI